MPTLPRLRETAATAKRRIEMSMGSQGRKLPPESRRARLVRVSGSSFDPPSLRDRKHIDRYRLCSTRFMIRLTQGRQSSPEPRGVAFPFTYRFPFNLPFGFALHLAVSMHPSHYAVRSLSCVVSRPEAQDVRTCDGSLHIQVKGSIHVEGIGTRTRARKYRSWLGRGSRELARTRKNEARGRNRISERVCLIQGQDESRQDVRSAMS
jgi:hypothetical protein